MIFEKGKYYEIKVKPNSSKSEIKIKDNEIIVYLKSLPQNNKANLELIKLFKKQLKKDIKIKKGLISKKKLIYIKN